MAMGVIQGMMYRSKRKRKGMLLASNLNMNCCLSNSLMTCYLGRGIKKMLVTPEEVPPVLDKIAKVIEDVDFDKMTISSFRDIVIKLRAGYEDTNDILKYFQKIGMIQITNGVIYKVGVTERQTSVPGRPKKLTDDEMRWIKRNYQPGKTSVRKLTIELNEKRKKENKEPISFQAIHKYYIC